MVRDSSSETLTTRKSVFGQLKPRIQPGQREIAVAPAFDHSSASYAALVGFGSPSGGVFMPFRLPQWGLHFNNAPIAFHRESVLQVDALAERLTVKSASRFIRRPA